MWQNFKADLRKVGKQPLSKELEKEVWGEINELTKGKLQQIRINPEDKTVIIRGKEDGRSKQEVWDIKEYLKLARKYDKLITRVDTIKQKYGIEKSYEYEDLGSLIMKKSRRRNNEIVDRGLENRIKTISKVLKKDVTTGESQLVTAGKFYQDQLEVKYAAYENQDDYMRAAGIDVSVYKDKKGKFISPSHKREYLKKFNQATDDQDFSWSEFMTFLFNNYVDSTQGQTTRTFWKGLSKEEKIEIVREYREEQGDFDEMVDTSEGTIRAFQERRGK